MEESAFAAVWCAVSHLRGDLAKKKAGAVRFQTGRRRTSSIVFRQLLQFVQRVWRASAKLGTLDNHRSLRGYAELPS